MRFLWVFTKVPRWRRSDAHSNLVAIKSLHVFSECLVEPSFGPRRDQVITFGTNGNPKRETQTVRSSVDSLWAFAS